MLSERSALVTGWVGGETIDIMVMRDAGGQWQLNGRCIENVAAGLGASGTERPSLRQNPREDAFTHELPSSPEADCLACDLRTLFHRSSHFGKSAVSAESPPRNSRRAATRRLPIRVGKDRIA